MKSKLKIFIKRCTIFLTVFVICFSCFSFSSAALSNNDNGLYIDYYQKPIIEYRTSSNGSWQTFSEFSKYSFTQTPDGSIDRMTYSWSGMYEQINPNYQYRVLFRFQLRGDNWKQYSLSMNGYFNLARDLNGSENINLVTLGKSTATSQLIVGGSKSFNAGVDSLGSVLGYHYNFKSFEELVNSLPDTDFKDYEDCRHSVYVPFTVSSNLNTLQFTITDFSNDLFFAAPSDKEFQDYDNAEQQILDSTEAGRLSAKSVFGGFGSLATYVSTPILAVGNIMGEFFSEIDILNTILRFSLSLGIFSFLVGMAVSIGGYFSSKAAKAERKASNAERSAYYRAGTAYYKSRSKK